jgi:hypothetical protein
VLSSDSSASCICSGEWTSGKALLDGSVFHEGCYTALLTEFKRKPRKLVFSNLLEVCMASGTLEVDVMKEMACHFRAPRLPFYFKVRG